MDHRPVYLHVKPLEGNRLPRPWAYFSFSPEPVQDSASMMTADEGEEGCDRFASKLRGVTAKVL